MLPIAPKWRSVSGRLIFFFCLWLMLAGWSPKDLPIGFIAACGALWWSLLLAPPRGIRLRPAPLVGLLARFLRGSVVAGVDVAIRALTPRLRLAPGFVTYPLSVPVGGARDAFCFYESLQPGFLPTGTKGDALVIHCLDVTQSIVDSVARDEALFKKATAP